MMPEPPRIGSLITGALITLLSSTMANGLPTFSRVASAKRRAPAESNLKLTTGEFWLKVGWASVRVSPLDHHAAAHDIIFGTARARLLRRQQLVARRHAALARVIDRRAGIDELERHLRGLADQRLDALGIVDAGQLDQDAVRPDALDRRFLGAGLVDPAAHDLDRLLDRRGTAPFELDIGRLDRDRAAGAHRHLEVGIDLLDELANVVLAAGLAQHEHDLVVIDGEPGISDLGGDERGAQLVEQVIELVLLGRFHVDFVEEIRAAAQVEAEAHLLVRQERGPIRHGLRREEIGNAEQNAPEAYDEDDRPLPRWDVKHRSLRPAAPNLGHYSRRNPLSFSIMPPAEPASAGSGTFLSASSSFASFLAATGWVFDITVVIVLRTQRTRTPSAIST